MHVMKHLSLFASEMGGHPYRTSWRMRKADEPPVRQRHRFRMSGHMAPVNYCNLLGSGEPSLLPMSGYESCGS